MLVLRCHVCVLTNSTARLACVSTHIDCVSDHRRVTFILCWSHFGGSCQPGNACSANSRLPWSWCPLIVGFYAAAAPVVGWMPPLLLYQPVRRGETHPATLSCCAVLCCAACDQQHWQQQVSLFAATQQQARQQAVCFDMHTLLCVALYLPANIRVASLHRLPGWLHGVCVHVYMCLDSSCIYVFVCACVGCLRLCELGTTMMAQWRSQGLRAAAVCCVL